MNIKELLSGIDYDLIQGNDDLNIYNICWDSRNVKKNSLFICTKARNVDRHIYAHSAIKNGAIAIVIDHEIDVLPRHITVIKTKNSRIAMASIANKFYDEPSKKFNLVGVTGTNGKTSVCYFVKKILEELGRTVGIIGTIENNLGNTPILAEKINPTTPDAIELQASLSEMAKGKANDVIMEVTSSALEQHRVDMCDFDIGIFTNLSHDHLEEHGTMENYKNAKLKLFRMCRLGIVNVDDGIGKEIIESSNCDIISYGIDSDADFMAKEITYTSSRTTFTLDFKGNKKAVTLNLPGRFNVYNSLAAISTCYFLGLPLNTIIDGLSHMAGIPGRYEVITTPRNIKVIVDYAHTPDSLKNILTALRELTSKRLIVVFGCGGDRDKTKRANMGQIAGELCDYCIITSDNPRNENPLTIMDQIEEGIKKTSCIYEKNQDRKGAIITALKLADVGDVVIIAGKGHESYQIIGDKKMDFNDCKIVKEYTKIHKCI